jgi:hypothetical protein
MPTNSQPPSSEPLRAKLSDADDCIRLNHWMSPQQGIFPRIRIGTQCINTLWALPIGAAALLCMIASAQSLRELPGVAAFIQNHPGIAQSTPLVDSGFPWWLQVQHFLNMFFMLFIMRSGRSWPTIPGSIGAATARRGATGFVSRFRCRWTASGPQG